MLKILTTGNEWYGIQFLYYFAESWENNWSFSKQICAKNNESFLLYISQVQIVILAWYIAIQRTLQTEFWEKTCQIRRIMDIVKRLIFYCDLLLIKKSCKVWFNPNSYILNSICYNLNKQNLKKNINFLVFLQSRILFLTTRPKNEEKNKPEYVSI